MSGTGKQNANNEDCNNCKAVQKTERGCPPYRNVTHPLRYYEFTQEEIKALEECDKESFYQRCVPFSALFATSTYAAIKYGYLKRHPHWGATPKVTAALAVGHMLGRVAYVPHCDRKLRDLPSTSYLGTVMRDHYAANNPPQDPKKR